MNLNKPYKESHVSHYMRMRLLELEMGNTFENSAFDMDQYLTDHILTIDEACWLQADAVFHYLCSIKTEIKELDFYIKKIVFDRKEGAKERIKSGYALQQKDLPEAWEFYWPYEENHGQWFSSFDDPRLTGAIEEDLKSRAKDYQLFGSTEKISSFAKRILKEHSAKKRDTIIKLAYLLKLDCGQTDYLLCHIAHEHELNTSDPEELIHSFCLNMQYAYDAKNKDSNTESHTAMGYLKLKEKLVEDISYDNAKLANLIHCQNEKFEQNLSKNMAFHNYKELEYCKAREDSFAADLEDCVKCSVYHFDPFNNLAFSLSQAGFVEQTLKDGNAIKTMLHQLFYGNKSYFNGNGFHSFSPGQISIQTTNEGLANSSIPNFLYYRIQDPNRSGEFYNIAKTQLPVQLTTKLLKRQRMYQITAKDRHTIDKQDIELLLYMDYLSTLWLKRQKHYTLSNSARCEPALRACITGSVTNAISAGSQPSLFDKEYTMEQRKPEGISKIMDNDIPEKVRDEFGLDVERLTQKIFCTASFKIGKLIAKDFQNKAEKKLTELGYGIFHLSTNPFEQFLVLCMESICPHETFTRVYQLAFMDSINESAGDNKLMEEKQKLASMLAQIKQKIG